MNQFCQDRDLLALEPAIFATETSPNRQLAAGNDGVLDGDTYSSATSDFIAAGVQKGMVLTTFADANSEGLCLEIIEVSQTSMIVSMLRADTDFAPLPPPSAGATFFVRTFGPQIADISASLVKKLTMTAELLGKAVPEIESNSQLRRATACGTLAAIFLARAAAAAPDDPNWLRSEHYRNEFLRLQSELRAIGEVSGNRSCRTLGNVLLRRV